ncbi:hypothetical protein [Pseudonocardia xishanensis]|uniref:hypothetical protein n=1 Tax=Pseudonocardia xishanensis TaxID=630995 RepID=UPI0031EAAFBC
MTVLPAFPAATALDRAVQTVAIPRQSRGAHRAAASPGRPSERSRVPVTAVPVRALLSPVEPVRARETRVSPALRGAAAAAYTIVARAGSLTTLAAMLVLGGAVAASTDDTAPSGAAASTATTLQGP